MPADKPEISKKVKVDLEVDTSVKDLGPNPYAKIIHMARGSLTFLENISKIVLDRLYYFII